MIKTMIAAVAAIAIASPALAGGATVSKTSNSQGSATGVSSSSYTGNGATISGNGDGIGPDQTTGPHSRVDAKIDAGVMNGQANGLQK